MAQIQTTVVLVEDNPLHALRFRENIAQDPSLHLQAEYGVAQQAMDEIAALRPDVALVDIGLPDISGFEVIRHIRAVSGHTAVLVVSVFGGERNLVEAIEAGATGYLLKDCDAHDFNRSIHAICAGESPISPSLARHLLMRVQVSVRPAENSFPQSPLSSRETTVLEAIRRGSSAVEIAVAMHISPLTVKSHVQNIYRKLEANSRQQAIYLAQQRGLLKT